MQNRSQLYNYADGAGFKGKSGKEIFTQIARDNFWTASESVSGIGSSLAQTQEIVRQLPLVFNQFGIQSMLDIPCGDFNWMKTVDLSGVDYHGGDIVAEIIEKNQQTYQKRDTLGGGSVRFSQLNLLQGELPKADLIFCRDCLVHFSFADISCAIANMKKSGAIYLMTTHFPEEETNLDIPTGGWRPLNLLRAPFHFPEPVFILNEKCTEMDGAFSDKSLALWKLEVLEAFL